MEQLHKDKQYWVPIVDPGIKVDPGYPAYDQGIAAKAFISDFTGNPYLGQVNFSLSSHVLLARDKFNQMCLSNHVLIAQH